MSTFLSRVAARAVGTTASARPRPVALFESGLGPDLVEVADKRVTVGPTPPAAERDAPAPAHAPAGAHVHAPQHAPRPARAPVPAPPPHRQGRRPALAADSEPEGREGPDNSIDIAAERSETTARPRPARTGEPAAAGAPAAKDPSAQATPPALAAPAPPFAALSMPAAGEVVERAPEVRVHIGRLEVRANLQPAPAPPLRARKPEHSPDLSLTDYLRGSRRA